MALSLTESIIKQLTACQIVRVMFSMRVILRPMMLVSVKRMYLWMAF